MQRVITAALYGSPHEVALAADGVEGLRLIQQVRPNVVFTDLQMPRMGGAELAAVLKGDPDLAAIPIGAYVPAVIMKASHTTPEEALRAFADVRGQRFIPIHWGTFDLAEEPPDEPPQRLVAETRRLRLDLDRIWVLKHGETRFW